ncbi:hypothetical protein DM558_07505 [Entomomonas moraniae]|uniref:Uncharacterized protein n=1 Tax=Entomomonas moraniae TaxID=2213226 RepID=A0A3S9XDV2_9GAMM|nr:hypothetical protein [Entomomonas moraniae]AZS50633.1 hypothetical protein DM558_07505 [Entomomonas moraniae]
MMITIDHVKAQGYCAKGARVFFKEYGLNWQDFLAQGIEANTLLATHNEMAIALVKKVQENEHGHG